MKYFRRLSIHRDDIFEELDGSLFYRHTIIQKHYDYKSVSPGKAVDQLVSSLEMLSSEERSRILKFRVITMIYDISRKEQRIFSESILFDHHQWIYLKQNDSQ